MMGVLVPGTVFFTRGSGVIGWCIRHGAGAFSAHCGVVVAHLDGSKYLVVEAIWSLDKSKSGVRLRVKDFATTDRSAYQYLFVDVAGNDVERDILVMSAVKYVGTPYDLRELARIAARGIGIKWDRPAGTDRMICSHHVTEAVVSAVPAFEGRLPVPVGSVWPGLLAACLLGFLQHRN